MSPTEMFPAGRGDLRARRIALPSGITLRIVEAGADGGRTVLLLHGWGASAYMWRDWYALLAAAGFRVIAPDLPGHGLSDKPDDDTRYTSDALRKTVEELLGVLGATSADVIAQSMSGTIAIALATQPGVQVGRVAVVNPALFGRVRMERLFKMVSPPLLDAVLPRLVRRWIIARTHRLVYGDASRLKQRDVDEYWAPSQFPAYARAMRRLLHVFGWERADVATSAERIRPLAPRLLVILGTKDRLILDSRPYVAELHTRLPSLRVHEAVGGGHAVNEERPEELVPIVRSFLLEG